MDGERKDYQAYLVRLWRVRSSGKWLWRAAIESPHTGKREAFADLAGLFAYLERQTIGLDLIEPLEDGSDSEEGRYGNGQTYQGPSMLEPW